MAEPAGANGAASDATVGTGGAGELDRVADAQRNLDAALEKVKLQQDHLAGAKDAVAEAKAALAAVKKDED
jgi:hypothetical protein